MTESAEAIVFWILAVPLLAAACGVVLARSPVHAAMSLVAAFFCLAGIYVLLTAHLIAVLQVLVYAGAIMVLFLFVIMLLALSEQQLGFSKVRVVEVLGVVGAAGMAFLVVWALRDLGWMKMPELQRDDFGIVSFGTVKLVGEFLFTQYLLPFEATSVLLLVAIVGAVVVAKEKI